MCVYTRSVNNVHIFLVSSRKHGNVLYAPYMARQKNKKVRFDDGVPMHISGRTQLRERIHENTSTHATSVFLTSLTNTIESRNEEWRWMVVHLYTKLSYSRTRCIKQLHCDSLKHWWKFPTEAHPDSAGLRRSLSGTRWTTMAASVWLTTYMGRICCSVHAFLWTVLTIYTVLCSRLTELLHAYDFTLSVALEKTAGALAPGIRFCSRL